jgi:multiple sugar transport system substrate-binding protein
MKRTPWRWSVVTVATGLTLAGCAQGTVAPEGGEEVAFDSGADVSGALSILGYSGGDEIGDTRMAEVEAQMPDVDIELIKGDLDIQQFLSAVAAGDPPELIYANRDQIGTFASRNAIIPLDSCIEGEEIDTAQYRESALEQVTFDDNVYGIPEFNGIIVTMANADLLSAAGLSLEDVNGSDWDAMTAAAQAMVKNDGGLSVIGVDSKLPEFLPLWAKANGADLLSEDGRTANLDDPKVVEALEWAVGIYDAQGGFPAVKAFRDSNTEFFGAGNQFAINTLGAMPMEHWYINVLNENSPDAPMAFDTVKDREGNTLSYATGSAWAIPAGTANPEAACRLMKVMTDAESWVKAAQARVDLREEEGALFTGLLTGNAEADEQIRELVPDDAPEPWISAIDAMYEANDAAFSLPANPADAEFKTAWQDAVNRVLNGQATPQESLAQGQEEAQAVLDDAWASWDESEG